MARTVRRSGMKQVPLSEIKDDLSRFLREAETQDIIITRHGKPAGATSTSAILVGRIRALTEPHPITPTSPRCLSAGQPNLGRRSTYRCGKSVQTTGPSS